MKTSELLAYLFGGTGIVSAVVMFLLNWARFKTKDRSDSNKTDAEAQEIRAKSDVLITDGALRIVERLSKDLDEAREEIDKLIVIASDLKILHEKHRVESITENELLINKLKEANNLIEIKKRHCINVKNRVMQLRGLMELKQSAKYAGMTPEQLEEFLQKITELITYNEEII